MKLAIIGSRSITDDVKVLKTIHNYCVDNIPSVILKSAGKGIDPTIQHYAKANEILVLAYNNSVAKELRTRFYNLANEYPHLKEQLLVLPKKRNGVVKK